MPKVLTVSHSYVVALNRRLVRELAAIAGPGWSFEAVAPRFFHADLRSLQAEPTELGDGFVLHRVGVVLSKRIHLFAYGLQLRKLLHQGFDLVHAWEEPYIVAGAQLAAWTPSRTALVFATFQNIQKQYPPPFAQMEEYALNRSAAVVAWGETVAEAIASRRPYQGKRIRTITPGVDLDAFQPDAARRRAIRSALGWENEQGLTVGFVGRFVEEKGVRRLTRILDTLKGPWRALFVGSGPLEHALREWAMQTQDRARIVTGIPHTEVPGYLNAMDVLCAPSQTTPTWQEQFGRMLIEAFASGVPVVASDSGEIPRTVGDAGIILPEADEERWASTLEELIECPALLKTLAESGLQRAQSKFAWPVIARAHLDFFSEILDQRSGRAKNAAGSRR